MLYLREYRKQQSLEYSQNVESAGRQLLFMINQFLDLSRIDMGKEEEKVGKVLNFLDFSKWYSVWASYLMLTGDFGKKVKK